MHNWVGENTVSKERKLSHKSPECGVYLFLDILYLRGLESGRKLLPSWDSFFVVQSTAVIVFQNENVEEVISLGLMERTALLMTLDFK